ncbi:hypothetical protein GCM10028807_15060 [Spirosoma daeguense]
MTQAAHAQVDTLFHLSPDQRILRLWQQAPFFAIDHPPYLTANDSTHVFAQLDRLAAFATEQDDERLFWTAQLHKILFRHTLTRFPNKISTVLSAAQPYLDQCPVPVVLASYWYHRGSYEYDNKQFDEGFRWLLRAQQAFEQIGYDHIPEVSEYLRDLGVRYYFFGEYATCIRFTVASFRYPPWVKRAEISAHNTVGLAYQHLHQYAQAQNYFTQTLKLAEKHSDSAYVAIANTNLGHLLMLRSQPRLALPYLYKGYQFSWQRIPENRVPENAALTDLYLAQALLDLDSTLKAKTHINRSTQFFTNRPWSAYDLQYYQAQMAYYKKTGEFRRAMIYQDSLRGEEESQRTLFNTRLLTASQGQVNAERYLNDLRTLENDHKNAVLVRNIILIAAVLLTLAGAYALRQNQRKRALLLVQKQQAEQLLSQYIANIQEKNQLIDTISAQLHQDEPSSSPIKNLIARVILTEEDWQQFKDLFEDVHPGFFSALLTRYPDLTKAEIRLLALLKLQIDSIQMSRMLGISPESIYKTTYRLRKKLGVSGKLYLNDLLDGESPKS